MARPNWIDMTGMVTSRKVISANILLAMAFLIYLCALDMLFILKMNEQKSEINDMGLFIIAMPFIGAALTLKFTKNIDSWKVRMTAIAISFVALGVVGFLEFLWVATHFHAMLGGRI